MRVKESKNEDQKIRKILFEFFDPAILLLLTLILWICIFFLPPELGNLGIYDSSLPYFPILIFVISLLLISYIFSGFKSRYIKQPILRYLMYIILILSLFLTPSILEGSFRFLSTYKYRNYTLYLSSGSLLTSFFWAHNWPGALFQNYVVLKTIGTSNLIPFFEFYPFIIEVIFIFCLIGLGKVFDLNDKQEFFFILFFIFGNWISQDYFNEQSIGFVLLIAAYIILYRLFKADKIETKEFIKLFSLYIIIIVGLLVTHLLTALVSIFAFLAVLIKYYKKKPILSTILLIVGTGVTATIVYFTLKDYIIAQFQFLISRFANLWTLIQLNLSARITGTSYHLATVSIRIVLSSILVLISLFAFLYYIVKRDSGYKNRMFYLLLTLVAFIPVPIITPYGGELFMRMYLFALPLIGIATVIIFNKIYSISNAKSKQNMQIILMCLLLVLPHLHFIAHYGDEKYDYFSPAEYHAYDLLMNDPTPKIIIGGLPHQDYSMNPNNTIIPLKDAKWNGTMVIPYIENKLQYIIISLHDRTEYIRTGEDIAVYWLDFMYNISSYFVYYDSSDITIFRFIGVVA